MRQVLEALGKLDYSVDLVTYPVGRDVDLPGVRIFRPANPFRIHHVPIGFSWKKALVDLTLLPVIRRRLRENRYLCVHAVEEAAFPAVVLARRHGVPVVYDMQSSLSEQLSSHPVVGNGVVMPLIRRLERWLLEHADMVVCSRGLREKVRSEVPGARVREWTFEANHGPVPEGAVPELRERLGLDPRTPIVLYCGSFASYQGLSELLASVPRVAQERPEAHFVFVGAEGDRASLVRRQANDLGIQSSVTFVGRVPRDEVPRFLALAEVLVSPRTRGGNLPLKIFEYLAAGRAIVASDIPAHRSILDSDSARLVEPTAEGYGNAIIELLRNPEERRRLREGARRHATLDGEGLRFVRSVSDLYAEVASLRGRRHTDDE